jgi:putative spermidine/putrescine transport system ATP-binding protein
LTQLSEPAPPDVRLSGLRKSYGAVAAVDGVDLEIGRGEFFTMLGPSGSGKTTTLRMIAGFERPDAGTIELGGKDVSSLPPFDRDVNTVFQDYALFPHMTVQENVEYGLRVKKVPKAERQHKVKEVLRVVRLGEHGGRKPAQLSGGQRQRVALARALVLEPDILLLDEPLGAIDLKLRKEMQLELKALNKQLGTTFVYVTHDKEEALTMSDRIAVMDNARVAQLGTPAEIYENPRTAFVAKFIGESNFFEGRARQRGDQWELEWPYGGSARLPGHPSLKRGELARIAVRPEWMDVWRPDEVPAGENALAGTIEDVIYLGETMHVLVRIPHLLDLVTVAVRNEGQLIKPLPWKRGDTACVAWLPEDCQILEEE